MNKRMDDLISRQVAIEAIQGCRGCVKSLKDLSTAQPTLYGYDIKHLMLIAEVLKKENLPPERVTEALMDIGRIVSIVRDEFEETLREAMKGENNDTSLDN